MPNYPRVIMGEDTAAMIKEMGSFGYPLRPRPRVEIPTVPRRLTDLTDDDLMELFVRLTWWSDHVDGQLAIQEIDERNAIAVHESLWTQKLTEHAPRNRSEGSVTVAKAETDQDPEVRAAKIRRDLAYGRRKWMQIMSGNLARDCQIVSRELTRRIGREGNEARADRYRP